MRERVLLCAEDNDAEFHLIKLALAETPLQVQLHRVADGAEALAFLEKKDEFQNAPSPELVILDADMPKIDGFEVLRRAKQRELLKDVPVVVFTAYHSAFEKSRALALGAAEYITKSYTLRQSLDDLKNICMNYLRHDT